MSIKVKKSSPKVVKTGRPSKRQLELLGFFSSREFSDEEINDIQNLIADYYAEKADAEMDLLVEEKNWSQKDFDRMSREHVRIPYRSQESK